MAGRMSLGCMLLCISVYIFPQYSAAQTSYNLRTISIKYPSEKRINTTQAKFIECIKKAGLQVIYDSIYRGNYYYDTSSLAFLKRRERTSYTVHFWRVRNYHHGADTIPEITFSLSGRFERFCVISPASSIYERPSYDYNVASGRVVTAEERKRYLNKVDRYTRVVKRHFKKDMCKHLKL